MRILMKTAILMLACFWLIPTVQTRAQMNLAPDREPGEFRGIAWGADVVAVGGMELENDLGRVKEYYRNETSYYLGKYIMSKYTYYFFENRFYKANIIFISQTNYDGVLSIFKMKYGLPRFQKEGDISWNIWRGQKVEIEVFWNEKEGLGNIFYSYLPIARDAGEVIDPEEHKK